MEIEVPGHARIVIVGGGIMGVGLLYHLAEEGCSDALLIEKGELTSGSTWHAAGQCPSLVGNYNLAKIHHHGNTLYPKLEELTGQYVSWHAAMDRFIRFDKDDFIGKQATLEQAERGLSWKLVYFEIDASDSDVRGGEPVFDGDLCIGVTTSGGYGHYVQKSLGFAYVDIAYAGAGTCFDIDLLGDRCNAEVLAEPVYDPGNHNLRA